MSPEEAHTRPYDAKLIKRATYASVIVAIALISVKLAAWLITNSVSLQATLIDSLLDAAASLINLVAVRHALQPPDKKYRFGYGKAEAIAAMGQSVFISGSAIWLLWEAYQRFSTPEPVLKAGIGIIVMGISMVLTFALIMFQKHVVAKTNSAAIRADSIHYRSDFLINGGVIVVLVATKFFEALWLDPLCGTIIALYILYTAWTIVQEAVGILMDRELPENQREKIIKIATTHKQVQGVHELRTRSAGWRSFIQLHLELDGSMTLNRAHIIADEVEQMVRVEFPNAELIIHEDPAHLPEDHSCYFPET
jgi:ferrous-iron efflux pump FieF